MNIVSLKKVLPVLLKHDVVPFLWGNQGIGKTQSIKQYAKENNLGFVHLHAATQDVGDLVGLLIKTDDGRVKHARPEWMPTEGEGIFFLDELNRASSEVLQALFSFITEGTIHTHRKPLGWKIVAAGNYQNNSFNVTDTSDAAWLSRFCHIDVKPDVAEFVSFAEDKNNFSVASFIRENPNCLESDGSTFDKSFIKPDRRAWIDMIGLLENDCETLGDSMFEVYAGCVGTAAASSFIANKKKQEKTFSIKEILKDYPKVRPKVLAICSNGSDVRLDILNSPIEELIIALQKYKDILVMSDIDNLIQFLIDIPLELSMKLFDSIKSIDFLHKKDLMNNARFVEHILKG